MKLLLNLTLGFAVVIGAAAPVLADGSAKSVTGHLEDSYCYSTMGAKGASHAACALKCAKSGIPVALVEKGSGKIFVLLPNKDASPLSDEVLKKMEDEVTITGKEYSKGGVNYLVVDSVK